LKREGKGVNEKSGLGRIGDRGVAGERREEVGRQSMRWERGGPGETWGRKRLCSSCFCGWRRTGRERRGGRVNVAEGGKRTGRNTTFPVWSTKGKEKGKKDKEGIAGGNLRKRGEGRIEGSFSASFSGKISSMASTEGGERIGRKRPVR